MIIPFCLFLSTHSSKNREIDTIMSRKVIEFDRCKEVELSFINTSVSRGTYRLFSSRSSHQCPFYLWCWRCLSPKIDLLALIHCLRYLLSRYHSGLLLDHLYIVDYPTQYWLAFSSKQMAPKRRGRPTKGSRSSAKTTTPVPPKRTRSLSPKARAYLSAKNTRKKKKKVKSRENEEQQTTKVFLKVFPFVATAKKKNPQVAFPSENWKALRNPVGSTTNKYWHETCLTADSDYAELESEVSLLVQKCDRSVNKDGLSKDAPYIFCRPTKQKVRDIQKGSRKAKELETTQSYKDAIENIAFLDKTTKPCLDSDADSDEEDEVQLSAYLELVVCLEKEEASEESEESEESEDEIPQNDVRRSTLVVHLLRPTYHMGGRDSSTNQQATQYEVCQPTHCEVVLRLSPQPGRGLIRFCDFRFAVLEKACTHEYYQGTDSKHGVGDFIRLSHVRRLIWLNNGIRYTEFWIELPRL